MDKITFIKDIWYDGPDECLYTYGKRFLKASNFFIRQGNLDASCAVYSLMMMLMIHKKVTYGELTDRKKAQGESKHGWTGKMKLQDMFLHDFEGAYFKDSGYNFGALAEDLHHCFKKYAKAIPVEVDDLKSNSEEKIELRAAIKKRIDEGYPVEIGFRYKGKGYGHAVVAIGYTYHKGYFRLLCLDPGYELPQMSFWNAIVDIYDKDDKSQVYSDLYCHENGFDNICVDQILTIE